MSPTQMLRRRRSSTGHIMEQCSAPRHLAQLQLLLRRVRRSRRLGGRRARHRMNHSL